MSRSRVAEFKLKIRYGLKLGKPILLLRILKNILMSKIVKRTPLKYIDVAYDYACNLRCEHCFARNFTKPDNGRQMTIEDHRNFVNQAMKLGPYISTFREANLFLHLIC